MMSRSAIPAGTVTFLFTDIEQSTMLAQKHPKAISRLLARHHAILREAIQENGGHVFQIVGDSFCAAFNLAPQAVNAAVHAQRMLHEEKWEPAEIRVRMGITTGSAQPGTIGDLSAGYTGYATLARAQRVMSAAHGGQILLSQSAVELARAELPDGVTLREMGAHRFKGFPSPETVWQAVVSDLPYDFPPLRSLAAVRNNLPLQVTSFVGREHEIRELKGLLLKSRILTLTGAGGTGKTRLALELAGELLDSFQDGVWFVDLAPLVDPALVTNVIASVLGVQDEQGRAVFETILRFLEARVLVLILDNCEHMLDACRHFADVVVHSCRELRVLCTSREALRIAGEQVWHVANLPTADPRASLPLAEMERVPAIHLFVERSRSVSPAFRLTPGNMHAVADICHRLDGIPLALELAAARVRQLGVEQIAARLGESFRLLTTGNLASASRQQTLRALIDWSYALLTDSERMMLRRLAVFAGGWTIDAAESVCAGELLPKDRVLEVMLRLADKSLLLVEERDNVFRYRMLETIRQYAAERLAESKDHADLGGDSGEERLVRIRHRDWCLRFAEEAGMGIGGADEVLWLERVEAEHDNLRSVLKRSLELREMDSGLRLAGTLWQFWLLRGHFTEGIQWMQRLLSEGSGDPALRAEALLAAASLSFRIGEMKAAKVFGMESLSLFDSQKNTSGAGRAAYALGILSWYTSDEASRPNELLSQSLGFAKESGLPLAMAAALNSMAFLACFEGDYPHAQDLLEHALSELKNGKEDSSARASFVNLAWATPVCDERGDWCMVVEETLAPFRGVGAQLAVGYTLANLGALARSGGDLARAKVMLSESLAEFRKAGDDAGIAQVLGQLGNLASSGQDFESAGALLEDSLALRKQLGDRRGMGRTLANLGMLATRMGDFARAHAHLEEGLALFRGMGDKPGLEQALSNLGTLALAEGDPRAALRIFTDVLTMHKQMGNKVIEALTLFNMGVAAKESGHGVNARQHLEDSLACYRPFGDPRIIATIRRHLRALPPQKNPRASDGRMKPARSRKKK